ncbi:MAG: hypothetical protein P1U50_11025 [Parvibaculaceae bacterium]|nr:hypothetical protein [Parvibaculaceae bacterium]
MANRIIYTENGTVKVVIPANEGLSKEGLTLLADSVVPDGLPFSIIDEAALPSDRTFRNAWQETGGNALVVDIEKAQEIQRQKIRAARVPLLAALDADQLRGLDVEEQKQILRDYPTRVDGVTDLAALKEILP